MIRNETARLLRRTAPALATLPLALALSGCGTLTGLNAENDFSCPMTPGVSCRSLSDTYEDSAFVRMTGFGDSSIYLMVSAYLRTADLGVFLRMQNDLNLNIMDVMKADGVDFAFPSTTVYLAKEN